MIAELLAAGILLLASPGAGPEPDTAAWRELIEQMKRSPKGPFQAIRWFCRDGAVLPPTPGACRERGGGVQHGLWSEDTRRLRAAGYHVGNVLAAVDPAAFTGPDADLAPLVDLVLERFLIEADDGWILRGARSYRGAFQVEDEEAAAARLLLALAADPAWVAPERFPLLREVARLLPAPGDAGATHVRQLAGDLAERDPGFAPLRNKIHSLPDAGDAGRVRAYAARAPASELAPRYAELARDLEALYDTGRVDTALRELARPGGPAATPLRDAVQALAAAEGPQARLGAAAPVLSQLRRELPSYPAAERVRALRASLLLERVVFTASVALRGDAAGPSRRHRLSVLAHLADALYGSGLVSARQHQALGDSLARLGATSVALGRYRRHLGDLRRAADWAGQTLLFHFSLRLDRLGRLDAEVHQYVPDRLRGSPLLVWNDILDELLLDASELAQASHRFFGRSVGAGLRGLNPGLSRGLLRFPAEGQRPADFTRDEIVVLPHTQPELPPVAGILTRGEGSSLSHVQLLARNLGIPNVVVAESLMDELTRHAGQRVVLAVSSQGRVELDLDGPRWERAFGARGPADDVRIEPDLAKLDLSTWRSAPLDAVRSADSGRIVGPKAANLGELHHLYGERVPRGVVIPFGAFWRLIQQPRAPGGPAVFEWMVERYRAIEALDAEPERQRSEVSAFLGELRRWIESADPGPELRADLRATLEKTFGPDGRYGVFVRSDTNVEDLPGFTGAGLNLTVPHVVGFEAIVSALGRVWASPFSERAYAWRQAHMEKPEYVFPGVVLLESVDVDKSGVLVSADVDTGDRNWISVAASEGVGGAVEGQAAEELRVRRDGARVRLLAQASAPLRSALAAGGGVVQRPASGTDTLLQPGEIAQLVALVADLPQRFPAYGAPGAPAADVEFGFRQGRLALFQIRPFVESRRARRSRYLRELDRPLQQSAARPVDMDAAPRSAR